MNVGLNAQQERAQQAFRAFVDQEITPYADLWDRQQQIPGELVARLAGEGYLGALSPEEHGGLDMDMVTYGLLCEQLAWGSCSVQSMVTVQNMIGQAILRWGSQYQKELWLGRIARVKAIAAFALTEPDVGSDAKAVQMVAVRTGDSYILSGHKKWISFGQLADLFLVLARCEGKHCAFLIEKEAPGLRLEPVSGLLGFRASMLAELFLDGCELPESSLLGAVGFGFFPVILSALNVGRYSVAWGCVGLAQACLDACIDYMSKRRQFDAYLKEHQLLQQMIADMVVNAKAARLLCCQAGRSMQRAHPDSVMDILVAKYFASAAAKRAADDAVQIHGAVGCSGESPIQRYFRDARVMEIIEGTTQMHQIQIAKHAQRAQIET